jgi:hypothetical protein
VPQPERPDLDLRALLAAAVRPDGGDPGPLAVLTMRCWPGGPDRTVTAALEWLRRWGPRRTIAAPPVCTCAQGRCSVCN